MLSFADLEFFGIVARSRSLAAAARTMDVTPSAVTQRLQELERRMDVRLLSRSGGRLALTDEGELLLARGRLILDEVNALTETFAARRGEVVGPLRVLAPLGFGRRYVAPIAAQFAAQHPAVTLDMHLSDRPGSIPDNAWDVAIHLGGRREQEENARVLAPNSRLVCASPTYVDTHGTPSSPHALSEHQCIALRENDEDVTLWRFSDALGAVTNVRITPRFASNDGDVVRDWAIAGHGIVVRSEWSVADDLRAGRLVRLLEDYRLPSADVVALIAPRGDRLERATRFLRALEACLTPTPWRESSPDR